VILLLISFKTGIICSSKCLPIILSSFGIFSSSCGHSTPASIIPLIDAKSLEPVTGGCLPISRTHSSIPLSFALLPANTPVKYAAGVEDVEYFQLYFFISSFEFAEAMILSPLSL
jgi:hypothetical protein